MAYSPSYIKINKDTAFIEGNNIVVNNVQNTNKRKSLEKNIIKDGNIRIDISPGCNFSKVFDNDIRNEVSSQNSILRNSNYIQISENEEKFYLEDKTGLIYPFHDSINVFDDKSEEKRINRQVKIKHMYPIGLISNEYHIYQNSDIYKDISDEIDYLINTTNEDDVYLYPFSMNDFDINKNGANIDIFERISEIKRSILNEYNIRGFKASFGNFFDVRRRSITITNSINKHDTQKSIEVFLDRAEDDDLYSRDVFQKKGKFSNSTFNDIQVTIFEKDVLDEKILESQQLLYISNDSQDLSPFIDRDGIRFKEETKIGKERYQISGDLKNHFSYDLNGSNSPDNWDFASIEYSNNTYEDGKVYSSQGRDFDYSISNGIDSIAFYGELN